MQNLVCFNILPGGFPGLVRTSFYTFVTSNTDIALYLSALSRNTASPAWANGNALPAQGAFIMVKENLRFPALRFWVLTPETFKRASLKKDGGTDSRPIVDGISLYVKNDSLQYTIPLDL